ncbi:MAG TPA: GMP reductase, partial [Alphaproteobacteria bacterium]|nr:GMP reductase [Alphaproteobacteria bacterium]
VDLVRTYKFRNGNTWTGVPIIPANMDTTGTFEMAKALMKHKMPTALHKHYSPEQLIKFYNDHTKEELSFVFYSMGIVNADYEKLKLVINSIDKSKLQNICIDVANGYTETFSNFVKKIRTEFPDKTIMAGNVVTSDMTQELIMAGADIIKVGIGPGSVCTTRKMTGVGHPQLSAIIECADAAHGMKAHVCGDGGCKMPGDIAKAFGAGADFVMSGTLFAGHDEAGGDLIEEGGYKFKRYYGMSSKTAMDKYAGGVASHRASEGKTTLIAYKGPVAATIQEILGGLRSTCTYVGASRLKDLSKCTTFIRVNHHHNTLHGD